MFALQAQAHRTALFFCDEYLWSAPHDGARWGTAHRTRLRRPILEGWLGVTEVDNPSVRERSAVCDARTIRSTWLI